MRISELIEDLQQIQKFKGDLECFFNAGVEMPVVNTLVVPERKKGTGWTELQTTDLPERVVLLGR
jgi:hypothetical protein